MQRYWERTGFTQLKNLEEYCALELNKFERKLKEVGQIRKINREIILAMENMIDANLSGMLLKSGYEP
jgi:hypothetical protein